MGASIGTVKSTKSLSQAMQTLFTKLTVSQSRKRQFYRREGFRVAVVTVGGLEIALGKRGNDFGVCQYNKFTQKVGSLRHVISFEGDNVSMWEFADTFIVWESPIKLSEHCLAMSHLFSELQKEKES